MAKRGFFFIFSLILIFTNLQAGGWNNTLMGWRALGFGGAFVGVADDPSAIFYNPAGLVFQKEAFNLSLGGFSIWPTHEYIMPLGKEAQSKYDTSLPQIFLSYRTSPKVTIGLGFYIPYAGAGMDWKEQDLGFPFKSTLGVYSITPTLAYHLNEKLSIGFCLNFYGSSLNVDTRTVEYGPMRAEEKGSAVSGGLGVLFKPTEKIGLGLGIRGPAKMKLTGKTSFTLTVPGLGALNLDLNSETRFNLPWDVELGFSYRISENLLFSTSAEYTMWSVLKKVDKTIKNIPVQGDLETSEPMNFKDILIWRGGLEYHIFGGVFLRGGIGLDRYATPEETLDFKNIDVDKVTFLGGIGYRTGSMQIDFIYAYAQGKERETTVSSFPGKYNLNVYLMGLGVTFSF
jgi:long-chain fatty acid transport protein